MKRLFIAIKLTPDSEFLDQLHTLIAQLRHEKIKWVEEHNIHITLKFLGETEESKIPAIIRIMQEVASSTATFSFSLKKLGVFGSSYDPRVVWAGIEPVIDLVSVMENIREKMKIIGYEPDRQNLVPHLTLGRIKSLRDKKLFQQIVDQHKGLSSQEITVNQFILFESILKKEGPVYQALQTFQLMK